MSLLQANIHTQAYFQALIAALESPDTKQLHLTRLKRVGLVTGGVLAGTVLLGPIGLIFGAGLAGSKAFHMKHYDEAFAEMLDVLRSIEEGKKRLLVKQVETLIGSCDTDALGPFIKEKNNKEKLLNLVSNFLSEESGYQWPCVPKDREKVVPSSDKAVSGSPYRRLGAPPVDDSPSPVEPCDKVIG